MKEYRRPIIIFSALFILYIIAELNKPKEIDWALTISRNDKNPYGGYVLYNHLKNIFPAAAVRSYFLPVYNQLNYSTDSNTAYLVLAPRFNPSSVDYREMINYISQGNFMLITAQSFGNLLLDSMHLKTDRKFSLKNKDSVTISYVNPGMAKGKGVGFLPFTIDQYFSAVDTANTTVLGVNDKHQPDFIKMKYGNGALFIHAAPVCFSNYFMLYKNNAAYTATALSYIPSSVKKIYWDEYYKLKNREVQTPLRFFLANTYLRWALRLALAGLIIYILFQMKRKQRVIPVIEPLANSSLDFIKTVSSVYYDQKDNKGIALKKVDYFLDFVRQRFYISTNDAGDLFAEQLSRKSGVALTSINELMEIFNTVQAEEKVSDDLLLLLDKHIDNFYKQLSMAI